MHAALSKMSNPSQELRRWQFGLRHALAATSGVAAVLSLAAWGGWLQSDAAVYVSITVLASVFSSVARRTLVGACVILGAFWLAMIVGEMLFGVYGRMSIDPRSFWISAGLLTICAAILRGYTNAGSFSLVVSLLLAEIFAAIVIVYLYGYSTLFEALNHENRTDVLRFLRDNFPTIGQGLIIPPWLLGIALGALLGRSRKGSLR